ncbi:ATP-dependent RNA helicase DbpA [Anaerohalosphaera lusitana]|uniref:ATP-dependent RNA helicase DbpA n=1 Tax=Anaerohalosphaera lusitana TaxID=1936003 RepID=A0A1U9NJ00_9BACT|nr:DEAD/DEAH box helicase family protein [Anaerohalosphaera lusitana]AQT67909.1 ATP-dependent RNA helicase DbpA [Anaerohalosphaera lusitana]
MSRNCQLYLPLREANRRKIGGNTVIQVAEPAQICDLTFQKTAKSAYLYNDSLGREFAIYPPRTKQSHSEVPCQLRICQDAIGPEDLTCDTKLKWLQHPADDWVADPKSIVKEWQGHFRFIQEDEKSGTVGLREPQIGAIHATAAHWTLRSNPVTVVMPTGTGKTETMLSLLVYAQCPRLLVVVPSDALRSQLFTKFQSLGCLRKIQAIPHGIPNPCTGLLKRGIHDEQEARDFANCCNVIVATASILNSCDEASRKALAGECTHLFVDEAHHLGAKTWQHIKDLFEEKHVVQFTATPFRRDGKRFSGKLVYNYPLGRAQKAGYFKYVDLCPVDEIDEAASDRKIAERTIAKLREDLEKTLDHLVLARVKNISDVENVVSIYNEIAPEFNAIGIHSQVSQTEKLKCLEKLENRKSRILVCVDMFGEGFDLPNLKIAAMHEIHRSLPITLQFVGRFTRKASSVGDASVVVNVANPSVDKELQALYAEDANWNELLRRQSESKIEEEVRLQELIDSFEGTLPDELPLWNLRPTMSALMFTAEEAKWQPEKLLEVLPSTEVQWHAINPSEKIIVVVFAKKDDVKWGRYKDIRDWTWHLIVANWNDELGLLFLHASNYGVLNTRRAACAIIGDDAKLVNGLRVCRAFSNIERPMVKNLGASRTGTVRYTMYFGPDVSAGLSLIEKSEASLNNLFGWGYENGSRITQGCSFKKGKLWSVTGGTINDWQQWCCGVGSKVIDENIDENEITSGFLKPQELEARPRKVPVEVEWGEDILRSAEDRVIIRQGEDEFRLNEVDIVIDSHSDEGPYKFKIISPKSESVYNFQIGGSQGFSYSLIAGLEIEIKKSSGEFNSLADWCMRDPLLFMYADGAFSYNNFLVEAECQGEFDADSIETLDWATVDIKRESEGQDKRKDSIQYKMIENIWDDYDVIFNDDDSGEAADIIAIRRESNDQVTLCLVHCKYSLHDQIGARVDDFYQLCGQAQKCIKWKHGGMKALLEHMKSRHNKWRQQGYSRFRKGAYGDASKLEQLTRRSKLQFEVMVVLTCPRIMYQLLLESYPSHLSCIAVAEP